MKVKSTKNPDYSNAIVGYCLSYNGKPTTKDELLKIGFTEEEIYAALNSRPKFLEQFSHLQTGLVLQYFNSGWHSISVIVKSNERFVWLKSWEDLGKPTKMRRLLKKELAKQGYSTKPCGYNSHPIGSKYIGKIIEVDGDF